MEDLASRKTGPAQGDAETLPLLRHRGSCGRGRCLQHKRQGFFVHSSAQGIKKALREAAASVTSNIPHPLSLSHRRGSACACQIACSRTESPSRGDAQRSRLEQFPHSRRGNSVSWGLPALGCKGVSPVSQVFWVFFCHSPKEAKKKHGKKGEAWAEHTPPGARLLISACHMCKAQVQVTLLSLRWAPRPTPTRVPRTLAGPRPGEEEPSMNAQRA